MNFSLFSFGFFDVKLYGLFVGLTFLICVYGYYYRLKGQSKLIEILAQNFWKWVFWSLVAGRIVALILNPQIFDGQSLSVAFYFWLEGFNFWGALTGFSIALFYDLKKQGESFYKWTDPAMPLLLLGLMIADFFGYITGAWYGRETSLPWGVQYETFGVDILNPIHPVTLYALILHFWWWLIIRQRYNIWKKKPGQITFYTILILLLIDLFLHSFRGDSTWVVFEYIRIEQIFNLALISLLILAYRKIQRDN